MLIDQLLLNINFTIRTNKLLYDNSLDNLFFCYIEIIFITFNFNYKFAFGIFKNTAKNNHENFKYYQQSCKSTKRKLLLQFELLSSMTY